ncbi:MAG: aminopeptidase N [Bdellovibrionota bacterium]
MKKIIATLCLCILPVACSKTTNTSLSKQAESRTAKAEISKEYAAYRAGYVSNVSYDLFFSMGDQKETFQGNTLIAFDLEAIPENLTIDYRDGKINSIKINGDDAETTIGEYFVSIPSKYLSTGKNTVEISYTGNYSKDGSGLYRFEDSKDHRVYIYSDFEPYHANRLFPCFDQPDLKATYTVQVEVPSSWKVITSVKQQKIQALSSGKSRWYFPTSKPFSTYVFALHAGQYREIKLNVPQVPSRLFVRESLAKYVDVTNWSTFTRQGFAFFQTYFDYPYPFEKYDQLIVPDFNWGGMENVGAVTYTERLIKRGTKTKQERMKLADVILHEMAHMWFGDLVTMKWWDDLWLNESFATYAAYLAAEKNTEFAKESWKKFLEDDKTWAYETDEKSSTHPIAASVDNTDTAFANFDGITYGKGSASLQQLSYLIGEEAFQRGVQEYFKTYAYKNTTLTDFVGTLDKQSSLDLSSWISEWIQSEGTNLVSSHTTCENGLITKMMLEQSANQGQKKVRQHRMEITLYDEAMNAYEKTDLTYSQKITSVDSLIGKACPAFTFLNSNDKDFVKVQYGEKDVAFIAAHLSKLKDSLQRSMIWSTLWNMTRNAQWSVYQYSELVKNQLPLETDTTTIGTVAETVYGYWRSPQNSLIVLLPQDSQEQKEKRLTILTDLAEMFWQKAKTSKATSDEQVIWFTAFASTAQTTEQFERIFGVLQGKVTLAGLALGQDLRWDLIQRLNETGIEKYYSLVTTEQKKDQTDEGVKAALACQAIRPVKATKELWLKKVATEDGLTSAAMQNAVLQTILPVTQSELRKELQEEAYKTLDELAKSEKRDIALEAFTSYALPLVCDSQSTQRLHSFLKSHAEISETSKKNILDLAQIYETCVQVKKLAMKDWKRTEQ